MNVNFYSLSTLPVANSKAAGSFVYVTAGENAGMWYCTGSAMIRLDNIAQDRANEVKSATIDSATGIASFKNADSTELFTLDLTSYLAAEIAKLSGSATIASVAEGVVTIKTGVSEADGKISNAEGEDIVLAKVATTGKAVDILLDPSAELGTTSYTTVQAAIVALATAFNGLVDDTNVTLKDLVDRLDVIEGEGEGSIKRAVADGIADVVAGANSDFDTLKEVADWIANDKTGAAALQATVAKLDGADTVEGSVAKAEKDAKAYTDERIGNLGKVSEEEGAADATVKDYVDKTASDIVGTLDEGDAETIADLNDRIDSLDSSAYEGVENADENQYVKVSDVEDNKQTLTVTIGSFTVPATSDSVEVAQVPGLATVEDVEKIITDNEKVVAAALNDLDNRVNNVTTTLTWLTEWPTA